MNQYDYLSGVITVSSAAPPDWQDQAVLPFWEAPNDERWGTALCQVLYHESLHFWQFLNSPFLIEIVGQLWCKLLHYEKTGELSLGPSLWNDPQTDSPAEFSNYELVECWARFWDVHTRNPLAIIAAEGIETDKVLSYQGYYTGEAYDTVMTQGQNCQLYAEPYRWLLTVCDGNSLMAQILFPLVANAAFSSSRPAAFFHKAMQAAIQSQKIRDMISNYQGQSVNISWLKCWDTVMQEVMVPLALQPDETLKPFQKAGYQAIAEGVLSTHPVFGQYATKGDGSNFKLMFQYFYDQPRDHTPHAIEYSEWINLIAKKMPVYGVYGMPGQPFYRSVLGTLVPPPRIEFQNFTWHAPRIVEVDISGNNQHKAQDQKTFTAEYLELLPRIKRFRRALQAVELGLPPDAFETD